MKKWLKRSLTILAIICAFAVYLNIGWFLVWPNRILFPSVLEAVSISTGIHIVFSILWPILIIVAILSGGVFWSIYGCYILGGLIWAGIKFLPGLIFTGGLFNFIFGNWITTILFLIIFGIPAYLWVGSRIVVPVMVFLVRRIFDRRMPKPNKAERTVLIVIWPIFTGSFVALFVTKAIFLGITRGWVLTKLIYKTWWRTIKFCWK